MNQPREVAEEIVADVIEIVNGIPNENRIFMVAGELMEVLEHPAHVLDTLDLVAYTLAFTDPPRLPAIGWIVQELNNTDYATYNIQLAVRDYVNLFNNEIGHAAPAA
jgi:hypothetical protein